MFCINICSCYINSRSLSTVFGLLSLQYMRFTSYRPYLTIKDSLKYCHTKESPYSFNNVENLNTGLYLLLFSFNAVLIGKMDI